MKKRMLSILLAAVLLFSAVPFAFAEEQAPASLPTSVMSCGRLATNDGEIRRQFYMVMNSIYVSATPDLSITFYYYNYPSAVLSEKVIPAEKIRVTKEAFALADGTVERLLVVIPLALINEQTPERVKVAAGSFLSEYDWTSYEFFLEAPAFLTPEHERTYYSRLYRESGPVSSMSNEPVGVGDTISLRYAAEVPFSVFYDGEKLADVPGGDIFTKDIIAENEGTHTITMRFAGMDWDTFTFTVKPQLNIYFSTLGDLLKYTGYLLLAPLISPLVFIIVPPAGIAAAVAPLGILLSGGLEGALEALFSIFNLLRR